MKGRRSRLIVLLGLMLGSGCTDQGYEGREPSAAEQAEIEASIRACGLPMRDARWVKLDSGQWSFGFATDEELMRAPNPKTACVDAVSDSLALRNLRPMIRYSGT